MSDTTLNLFDSNGPTAARLAFVPNPPTVATGADCGYLWWDTDLQALFAYDFGLADWVQVGGASGTVTNTGTLDANRLIIGNGGTDVTALGSLGTTTTLLHGNAGGAPTFGAVSLTADVTGTLPAGNGGTGITALGTGIASALGTNVGSAGAPVLFNGAGGTPSSMTLTSATGLPLTTGVTGDLPFANLTQIAAVSVLGVTGGSTADVAGIAAAADGDHLERASSSSLLFRQPPFAFIEQQTPTGTSVTFSSLGSFTHLELVWNVRGDQAATSTAMSIQFNADTGSNYDRQLINGNGTSITASESVTQTSAQIGTASAASAPSGLSSSGKLTLFDYRGTTFQKTGVSNDILRVGTGASGAFTRQFAIDWRSSSAITSMVITLASGNFVSGSKFTLYGLR